MKNTFLIAICILFPGIAFSQTTYTFTGNGYWTNASNWSDNTIPPSLLPAGSTINISPKSGDSCILDFLQIISIGAFINVSNGANLVISTTLYIKGSNLSPDSVFIDPRDGQEYTYRHIGSQVWMTKNLNYVIDNSWCYQNSSTNCEIYGRLYDWNTALTAVPPGWHLPSDAEWTTLTTFLGGDGGAMKKITGWEPPNTNASNSSGFSALPGGIRDPEGTFQFAGYDGYWWSSTENSSLTTLAERIALNYYFAAVYTGSNIKTTGLSVRCIRD